ncbi:MAG: hypothetical protein CEO22_687 [Candidatus Berkelbacteria bacterium Gr01-1014_85]|uniref:Uncharacterized protein n=1 Tax=Candidatus Berkelbacteria bacterium Gr01-1014_85 TaxID=2017150 RepID=A0A554J910_9BACT|nr:MAG: hypothetical protein CEO22_687 [Candidatus Berkelbacteria bacterium Gr01-1014_85]
MPESESSYLPAEATPVENEQTSEKEKHRYEELKNEYQKLYDYAKDQSFTVVYRAEGSQEVNSDSVHGANMSGSRQLIGSWYTENYYLAANDHKDAAVFYTDGSADVYALIIPSEMLEIRDFIAKGKQEINVMSHELREGRVKIANESDSPVPTLDNYLRQFAFVREYYELCKKLKLEP